ncbi:SepM family pheromone-processing serine protease [Virgibacillus kimchii]
MIFKKKRILTLVIIVIVAYFLAAFNLPYYIYKPGAADELDPIVEVDNGFIGEGDMHLVTVSGGQATPIQYIWAMFLPHHEIRPLEEVRPDGITDDEYMHAQLQMMESSQQASTVVAYELAGEEINIEYNGVFVVSVMDGMPAEGKLQMGDRIIGIDGEEITEADDLINYVQDKEAEETITVEFIREEETMEETITLESISDLDDRPGIGIQLVTDRGVTVHPEVSFSSGRIGGPSAGLMFSLEIYNQLTDDDITKGYDIAGTGEVDYDGNVYRVGGVDKKIVATDNKGIDIFFAPNENGNAHSNYHIALEKAEEIGAEMEVVPIDTVEEAIDYLEGLEPSTGS